eukprot:GGOE01046607.1.p2 GENE.GGOE01046607.1~~GGOE01046607.1.p2  ORF type:complete len:191 (+),score=59.65 GGOE01046607.1:44-574(+)
MPDLEPQGPFNLMRRGWRYALSCKEERLRSLRPWAEFLDHRKFNVPSKSEACSRVSHNLGYFYSNYVVVALLVTCYYLFTNVFFMISLAVCASAWYAFRHRTAPWRLGGTEITASQGYTALVIGTLLLFYLTSGSKVLFGLSSMAAMVCIAHAVAREPGINTSPSPEPIFDIQQVP